MKCPYCGENRDRVVDSRESRGGTAIRRRRECTACGRRYTSYERIEDVPAMVIKKDGRRELLDRGKVMAGLLKACEKRPVSVRALEAIADEVVMMVSEAPDRELPTRRIGELVMERLKELDKVAFVRFASVYRQFEDVDEFMRELRSLIGPGSRPRGNG
ncbi:MAG: transcriptional repressor NrdR [Acidobacteria bacterium]|nr:MAG: transcriptional repressor NrdR [Acidobacteriota bacterium]